LLLAKVEFITGYLGTQIIATMDPAPKVGNAANRCPRNPG